MYYSLNNSATKVHCNNELGESCVSVESEINTIIYLKTLFI